MSELAKSTLYLLDELRRLNDELYCKNAENAELVRKNAELLQVLSQRDAELAQNAIVLNDVMQELLSAKQELAQRDAELAQRDAELAQERICLRDRTLPAPIDIQVKLGEMFKTWPGLTSFDTPLNLKIRAATEQIKEPIMGLFHVTYTEMQGSLNYMYTDAMLFTATDVYYLSNCTYNANSCGHAADTYKIIILDTSRAFLSREWTPIYTFVDPKWVKVTAISENANFKKIIQCINQYSGYTGHHHSNPHGGNVNSASETAMHRRTLLQLYYMY